MAKLIENEDFYWENGYMVLTAKFLGKRGYCCNSGCRHCPYSQEGKSKKVKGKSENVSLPKE